MTDQQNNDAHQTKHTGWKCPQCSRVFSPMTTECPYCSRPDSAGDKQGRAEQTGTGRDLHLKTSDDLFHSIDVE